MVSKRKLLFITIIIVLSGVFVFQIVQKKAQHKADNRILREYTLRKNDIFEINEYIENISYKETNLSINFILNFNKKFSDLPVYDQFGVLYKYCKQMRLHILNSSDKRLLFSRYIHLTGNYNGLTYQFDFVPKRQKSKSKVVFFINGKLVYDEQQYIALMKDSECEIKIDYFNGFSDRGILEYTSRIFKLITNSNFNVKIEQDIETVLNAVIDKFNITTEDFFDIYKKYYLCINF